MLLHIAAATISMKMDHFPPVSWPKSGNWDALA
jgi:hypothetical protein